MIQTFLSTLTPMLVMFTCIIIGYIANKTNFIPKNSTTVISKLENYVFVPALVVSTFMNYCDIASLRENYILIIYSVAILIVAILISYPYSRCIIKNDDYVRNIYRYAFVFANFGFMGNAIVPIILGEEYLYPYMLFTLPLQIVVYTWGIAILTPKEEKNKSLFKNLINPVFIAIVLGIVLGLLGAKNYVPKFLIITIDYCKSCMAPMAMILTGFVIGSYNLKSILTNKKVYIATALRLVVLPAVFVTILALCNAPDTVLMFTFFAFATPLGMNTVVFPAAYSGETSTGASMAVISHTLCVITIPILFTLLQKII